MDKKLYVLVREDLSKSQQAVQAGHAVAEWMKSYGSRKAWENGTLVYLRGGYDEQSLEEMYHILDKLTNDGLYIVQFNEPDLDDEMTAFAILGTNKVPDALARFRLL